MAELSFVSSDDVRRYLSSLPLQEKEALLAEELRSLPAESRAKVLGLSNSGLTLVTGSITCLNSDVAIIQNTSAFDPETVFQSLADFWQSETNKNSSI
ncbi:hypothetical protein NIES4106_60590 (plasmid) [Fischerella sp. NIES-4106]|nr:hypothetical protein NIES4106_60590 [Fischerella sp. NIES-4106]